MENYYGILGCTTSSSHEEMKQSYLSLVLKYHPDKLSPDISDGEKRSHVDHFITIDKAWKILGDVDIRKEYDARWHQRCLAQQWPIQEDVQFEDFDEFEYAGSRRAHVYSCRCGGDYYLTAMDVQFKMDLVCCETCSLCIRVIYDS